jgi:hypothetical protein
MKKLAIIFSLFLFNCTDINKKNHTPIGVKDDITLCGDSCSHIKLLKCQEGNDLIYPGSSCTLDAECQNGICKNNKCTETCEMVCQALATEGRYLGLECWKTITKCEDLEKLCR